MCGDVGVLSNYPFLTATTFPALFCHHDLPQALMDLQKPSFAKSHQGSSATPLHTAPPWVVPSSWDTCVRLGFFL